MSIALLSHLWLHEPDAHTIARAVSELRLPVADPSTALRASPPELARAYAEIFLLNVPPYGTVYTDGDGELNAPAAQGMEALYAACGYRPPEMSQVGAPDHLGLCLGFLSTGEGRSILPSLLDWAPVCCFAVEREPAAHRFYRALAKVTRDRLMAETVIPNTQYPIHHSSREAIIHHSDVSLRDIVRFFLAPAQCGLFLSRSQLGQMAKRLGMRLPFGSRFEVAEWLLTAAGQSDQTPLLLAAFEKEVDEWGGAYRQWAARWPGWASAAAQWLDRLERARRMLGGMRDVILNAPLELVTDEGKEMIFDG
jgi:TorA maturation chaperone TorD